MKIRALSSFSHPQDSAHDDDDEELTADSPPPAFFFPVGHPFPFWQARGAGWCWGGGKVLTDGDAKARPAVASAGSVGATHRLAVWQTATWQVW